MKYELEGLVKSTATAVEETLMKIWLYEKDEYEWSEGEREIVRGVIEVGIREAHNYGHTQGWTQCGNAIIKKMEDDIREFEGGRTP